MPALALPPVQDWQCDVDGACIPLFCQVEQVVEDGEHTALSSRLHQCGQVVGQNPDSFLVCFGDNEIISLSPRLLRVLDTALGGD